MDGGLGLQAAANLLVLKKQYEQARMTCLMLWEEQAKEWPEQLRDLWFYVFAHCDREMILEPHRGSDNLQKRDAWLAENCGGLLVFKEGKVEERAWSLMERARAAGMEVQECKLQLAYIIGK